jgi:hypothetical protein
MMQYDEHVLAWRLWRCLEQPDYHVWAWRYHRFYQTGFMVGVLEITGGSPTYRSIDPTEYFL